MRLLLRSRFILDIYRGAHPEIPDRVRCLHRSSRPRQIMPPIAALSGALSNARIGNEAHAGRREGRSDVPFRRWTRTCL